MFPGAAPPGRRTLRGGPLDLPEKLPDDEREASAKPPARRRRFGPVATR